mgnify:CR=1 FL=1
MALSSMTGFAQSSGEKDGLHWQWEIKSVNGKALDLRCRLPTGFEALEAIARSTLAQHIKRGNLQVTLSTSGTLSGTPTSAGTFNFRVQATDADGWTDGQDYTLTMAPGASALPIAATDWPSAPSPLPLKPPTMSRPLFAAPTRTKTQSPKTRSTRILKIHRPRKKKRLISV